MSELSEDDAIRLVTTNAQAVVKCCRNDAVRRSVCVRLARLFSDYASEFQKRSAETKQTPVPRIAVSSIETALADTEKRRPSWMGDAAADVPGDERETMRAGLVTSEPVLKKDHR